MLFIMVLLVQIANTVLKILKTTYKSKMFGLKHFFSLTKG